MAKFEEMVYLGVNGEGSGKVNGEIGKGEGSGKAIVGRRENMIAKLEKANNVGGNRWRNLKRWYIWELMVKEVER